MDNIIRILNVFYIASGLKININKSNLYGVGVSSTEVGQMVAGSDMGHIINGKVLIDRFNSRLSGWKANLLSIGGRLTLIKSILGAFKNKKKLGWIKWLSILALFDKGGLGVGSLKAFNNSRLLKWRWHFLKNPSSLWVKVVKSIHGDEAGIDINGCQTNGLWASIVGTINHLHSSGIIYLSSMYFKSRLINMGRSQAEFVSLLGEIGDIEIDDDSDSSTWSISHYGDFLVSNARKHIDDCMIPNLLQFTRWYKVLSRKVTIFMWRLFFDRFPHRLNLSSWGLDIDSILCQVCNRQVECNIHIFFSCDTDSVVWRLVRAWSDYKIPILSSCEDSDSWLLFWRAFKIQKIALMSFLLLLAGCFGAFGIMSRLTLKL
ncbi:RNA-directed DNA polymerase, eukaryota, reverse transcriptase zinc-binding domain protein [Tanacetum coccineum]